MERKWQRIIVVLALVSLAGCVPYMEFMPDGSGKMSSYAMKGSITKPDGTKIDFSIGPEIPERWFSNVPKYLIDNFAGMAEAITKMRNSSPTFIPTPVPPAPVPAPVPPTPVPPVPTPPTPTPGPTPPPTASSVFSVSGNLITLDLNTLPGSMRAAGFPGSDNALYYAMAHIYAYGPGKNMVPHAELTWLNQNKQAIFNWFDGHVLNVIAQMKANPALDLIAITNDGRDRCGFRLGPAILARVGDAGLGNRAQLGKILPPEEY